MVRRRVDRPFLVTTIILVVFGLLVFSSATLGLFAREEGAVFWVFIKQIISLGIGAVLFFLGLRVPLSVWRKYGFYIFIAGCVATLLVFLPNIGHSAKGAQRWLQLGPLTFQPAEFLKLGYVLYLSALLAAHQRKITDATHSILPFLLITGIASVILLMQPNTGMFVVVALTGTVLFMIAGGRWKHFLIIFFLGVMILGAAIATLPHVRSRFVTFLTPHNVSQQDEGYQINQSLIAIGSGGTFGRGFGQSIQKFKYLPEPIGDSIFAVLSEELGFIGSSLTIFFFLIFSLLGLKIAARAPDIFSRLVASGIVILITGQSFLNIAAMLNLLPLAGVPVLFISQGGSALMLALLEVGILLNISRYQEH